LQKQSKYYSNGVSVGLHNCVVCVVSKMENSDYIFVNYMTTHLQKEILFRLSKNPNLFTADAASALPVQCVWLFVYRKRFNKLYSYNFSRPTYV